MTRHTGADIEVSRAEDLLVQRASEGLTESQARELDDLGGSNDDSFDLAAAMIDVATRPAETMPDSLAAQVLVAARAALRRPAVPFTAPALPAIAASMTIRAVTAPNVARPARRRGYRIAIAGALAAMLAAGLGIGRISKPSPTPSAAAGAAFQPASDDLVTHVSGAGVTGSIRWSTARQRGLLEIHGLPINDPHRVRYQIWIVDRERDRRYPVDGGLFDVGGPDTSYEFAAHIRVATASEFFITREAPDGAVVSDRADVVAR